MPDIEAILITLDTLNETANTRDVEDATVRDALRQQAEALLAALAE